MALSVVEFNVTICYLYFCNLQSAPHTPINSKVLVLILIRSHTSNGGHLGEVALLN